MATTLEMLLAALGGGAPLPDPAKPLPIPYAPVGSLGPLSEETTAAFGALNPEPIPPALSAPAAPDMGFINQYAGAAPIAPVLDEPTTLDELAAILGGIAGGPEYARQLRAERQEPIRRYERELEQFKERRTRGLEIAERRAEREQDRAQRAAENQYEREFQTWIKKTGVRDIEAKERMRQAFDIQKIREQERIADERQRERDKAQQERDARLIARDYGKLTDKPKIALELGRYYAGLTDKLSPEAAKFESAQARLAEIRARRAASGGGTGGGGASSRALKVAQEIQSIKDKMIEAEARGDKRATEQLILRAKATFRNAARYPEIEAGFDASGKWPYVKLRGPQGSVALPGAAQTAQSQGEVTMDDIRAYMQANNVDEQTARAAAQAAGYIVR